MSVNVQTDLETREPLYLKDSAIDFTLHIIDEGFDNDDNPFGEFKLHMFESMDGQTKDIVVPLKKDCNRVDEEGSPFHQIVASYCPDFSEKHYLKNDYNNIRSSWMRLALHECDPSKTQKCASTSEINDYFNKNILSLQMKVVKPNLMNYVKEPPLYSSYEYTYYSIREQTDLLKAREIFIQQNSLELDDGTFGFFDDPD